MDAIVLYIDFYQIKLCWACWYTAFIQEHAEWNRQVGSWSSNRENGNIVYSLVQSLDGAEGCLGRQPA